MATIAPAPQQLGLAVQLPDDETFATLVAGQNHDAIATLRDFVERPQLGNQQRVPWCVVSGASGTGKSHILHALCAASETPAMVLPLTDATLTASAIEGLEQMPLLCLDDIDKVWHQAAWSETLFALLNRYTDGAPQHRLVMTTSTSVEAALEQIALADLRSRLQWGLSLSLYPLRDEDKMTALQLRAKMRGLHLTAEAAQFLLQRSARSMHSLMHDLAQLDKASLAAKRRLTIPFIKRCLLL